MARYTGPATRISRRLNTDLVGGDTSFERRPYPPGQHGRSRIKQSEYLLQLQEKQKAKYSYGVLEKQFRRYYEEAVRRPGKTGDNLLQILESRLDNVVYRSGLARTRRGRASARQPRPLPRQRREGEHPELSGVPVRHHRHQAEVARDDTVPHRAGNSRRPADSRLASGRAEPAPRARTSAPRAKPDRRAAAGAADRRALLEVTCRLRDPRWRPQLNKPIGGRHIAGVPAKGSNQC